jgi:hypothetical protein
LNVLKRPSLRSSQHPSLVCLFALGALPPADIPDKE